MASESGLKVFLSYASEDAEVAADVAAALQADGHDVFFDRERLRGGAAYDAEIRAAIAQSDLFVFLISAAVLKERSYALTELKFARETWSSPVGRVLPVAIGRVDRRQLPAYLRRLTPLYPEGDAAAEVAAEVIALARKTEASSISLPVRPETAARQLDAYVALWSLTGLLPKWSREELVSHAQLAELSRQLRLWYFGPAGGLFLSRRSYSQYAALQEALQLFAHAEEEAISEREYEEVRELASLLRRQMAQDIGTRI